MAEQDLIRFLNKISQSILADRVPGRQQLSTAGGLC